MSREESFGHKPEHLTWLSDQSAINEWYHNDILKNNCDIRRQLHWSLYWTEAAGSPFLSTHGWLVYPAEFLWNGPWCGLFTMHGTLPGSFPFVDEVMIGSFPQRLNQHESKNSRGSKHNGPNYCLRDQRPTKLTSPEDRHLHQSRDPSTTVDDPSRDRGPSRMPGLPKNFLVCLTLLHRMPRLVMNVAYRRRQHKISMFWPWCKTPPPPPPRVTCFTCGTVRSRGSNWGIVLTMEICSINPAAVFMVRRIHGRGGGIVVIVARRLLHSFWTWASLINLQSRLYLFVFVCVVVRGLITPSTPS